jgi:hypothetical protein
MAAPPSPAGNPLGAQGLAREWSKKALLPAGRLLVEAVWDDADALAAAQLVPGVEVFPSLDAPASALAQWFRDLVDVEVAAAKTRKPFGAGAAAAQAVQPLAAGDDVQQAFRKFRDARGFAWREWRIEKES